MSTTTSCSGSEPTEPRIISHDVCSVSTFFLQENSARDTFILPRATTHTLISSGKPRLRLFRALLKWEALRAGDGHGPNAQAGPLTNHFPVSRTLSSLDRLISLR